MKEEKTELPKEIKNKWTKKREWIQKNQLPSDRVQRGRVLSTLRGWLFNGTLAQRVTDASWNLWQQNDLIQLNGTQSFFTESAWNEQLQKRFLSGDIHLAAYLAGCDQVNSVPAEMLGLFQLAKLQSEPRPLRLKPQQLQYSSDMQTIKLQFSLQKGSYATSVLRELVILNDCSELQSQK